ncbi:MAG: motility associated factor glycosyltransferase family protein [Desulfofustis sp.]|nr:motility associated factor glycosyltransferase family protein [Desulfofustis sp.]
MSMITRLRMVDVAGRPAIITELYEKNRRFFEKNQPAIARFLDSGSCPYHIDITDTFLNIVHTPSGLLGHPETGLDHFAEMLGSGDHQGWIDLVNAERAEPHNSPVHCSLLHDFQAGMNAVFPEQAQLLDQGTVKVKTAGAGVNFSPPVVFVGIFHGLHIDHFLATTEVTRIALIEPEPERFEVSCYFLDYEEISRRFGALPLCIGEQADQGIVHWLHSSDKITSRLCMRLLPGYVSERIEPIVRKVSLQQRILDGMTTSLDNESRGIAAGWQAVQERRHFLSSKPRLSSEARIAIVASGPSLAQDYEWLRHNQDRLLVFAVHSAVRPLRAHGIKPDLQFAIDMHLNEDVMRALQLHRDVPLVAYFKASSPLLAAVDLPLLIVERDVANPVHFEEMLINTHPSTASMALSFACFCRPAELYLLGLDLGFHDSETQAISGGIHDTRRKQTDNLHLVPANFFDHTGILTTPFFNAVKISVERELKEQRQGQHCCNLSDGARIEGTRSARSAEVVLADYPGKAHDLQAINGAFRMAEEGENWHHYALPGRELLQIFSKTLSSFLTMERWDWPQFVVRLDGALAGAMKVCQQSSQCLRMTIYERLINDLLTSWYRYLLLTADATTAEAMYREGLRHFLHALAQLDWPIDETAAVASIQ